MTSVHRQDPPPRLVTYEELADYLGVSRRTLVRYVTRGEITPIRIGPKLIRFDRDEAAKEFKKKQREF